MMGEVFNQKTKNGKAENRPDSYREEQAFIKKID
jgi:hypothetical protein